MDNKSAIGFDGCKLEVEDIIVYPGRSGSSLWMNKGKIVEVTSYQSSYGETCSSLRVKKMGDSVNGLTSNGKIVTLTNLHLVVKI